MALFEIYDPKAPARPIGIDLGTTNSLVAYVSNERPAAIADCDLEVLVPSVVAYLPRHNTMVVEFIEGETMSAGALRGGGHERRVAEACRRLHGARRFRDDFDMFDIQRRYLSVATSGGFRIPAGYDDLRPQLTAAEKALAVRAPRTVPCHNDLLAANFIDDGDRIWLIDYELSGNNDACFELGNIWAESRLPADALTLKRRILRARARKEAAA